MATNITISGAWGVNLTCYARGKGRGMGYQIGDDAGRFVQLSRNQAVALTRALMVELTGKDDPVDEYGPWFEEPGEEAGEKT